MNSMILRMANDWAPKKGKKGSKAWFFFDSDKDGVMNGIDCNPYNKNEQDVAPYIKATVPKNITAPAPQKSNPYKYSSDPNSNYQKVQNYNQVTNVSPQTVTQSVPLGSNVVRQPTSRVVTQPRTFIKGVQPSQYLKTTPITTEKKLVITQKTPIIKTKKTLDKPTRVSSGEFVSDRNQQNIVAAGGYKYANDLNINIDRKTKDENSPYKSPGTIRTGSWSRANNEIMISNKIRDTRDENATFLHEVSHAQDTYGKRNYEPLFDKKEELKNIYDQNILTGINHNAYDKLRDKYDQNIQYPLLSEVKARYISEYYKGNVPKNDVVRDFENDMNVTSKTERRKIEYYD